MELENEGGLGGTHGRAISFASHRPAHRHKHKHGARTTGTRETLRWLLNRSIAFGVTLCEKIGFWMDRFAHFGWKEGEERRFFQTGSGYLGGEIQNRRSGRRILMNQ